MSNDKGKSIEELRDKVHSGLELLSDEELSVLFEDAEQADQPQPGQTEEPSSAPATAESTPPVDEPAKGQASLLNLVPEKFRDKDEAASLQKMLKAMQEQETELTRRSQELSQLQNVVQELSRPREEFTYRPQPTKPKPAAKPVEDDEPDAEMDDLAFLDNPVASTISIADARAKRIAKEVAREVAMEQLRDYDTFSTRRAAFSKFKADHPDFDSLQSEFAEACRVHPEWDNDINGLPRLYEFARTLANARGRTPAQSTGQLSTPTDIEKLKAELRAEVEASSVEKAKQAILAEVRKRQAAAGIVPSSPGTPPGERANVQHRTAPLTEEEKVFQEMMESGPKTLGVLDPYRPSLGLERALKK